MKPEEKMDLTNSRALALMQKYLEVSKLKYPTDYETIRTIFHHIENNKPEDHFRLVLSLLEYDSPNLRLEDRYALVYQALRIYAAICNGIDRETVADALLEADDLYNNQEREAALELLNDTAQIYVL